MIARDALTSPRADGADVDIVQVVRLLRCDYYAESRPGANQGGHPT